jgi:hypothetical protein
MGQGEAVTAKYYRTEDIIVIQFVEPREAITVEIGDGGLAHVDPETREVIALEILNWWERLEACALPAFSEFGPAGPEYARSWLPGWNPNADIDELSSQADGLTYDIRASDLHLSERDMIRIADSVG